MAGNVEVDVPKLMSGAGHDAMAMSRLTKVSFLHPLRSIYLVLKI